MKYKKVPVPEEFNFYRFQQTELLPREIYEETISIIENHKRLRIYKKKMRAYQKKKLLAETNPNVKIPPKPVFEPVPIVKIDRTYIPFNHDDVTHRVEGPAYNIKGALEPEKASFVSSIESQAIERRYPRRINDSEVLHKANHSIDGEELKKQKELYEVDAKALREARKSIKKKDVLNYLKNYPIDEWILLITRLYKALTNLLKLIDLQVESIVVNSNRLQEKGIGTIQQLEELILYQDYKVELLNAYCLNKMWAGLLEDDYEREIFLVVLQRKKQVRQIESQKLRTAYRKRREIVKRFREFCIIHGLDREWFYEHFAFLPIVQYYAEHHDYDKRIAEMRMNAPEYGKKKEG